MSFLLTKTWHLEKCIVFINNQILSVQEYKILAKGSQALSLTDITVTDYTNENSAAISCEEILKLSPNINRFLL